MFSDKFLMGVALGVVAGFILMRYSPCVQQAAKESEKMMGEVVNKGEKLVEQAVSSGKKSAAKTKP
ncbi:MAG: hypothetical protein FWE53_04975 [Firmicutes bacterium]|nr:hypothetical protein [Bacillota bacterium]